MQHHHLISTFCLFAFLSICAHLTLYMGFFHFASGSGFPFRQMFGTIYHKEMSNGTWTYLNHFGCQKKADCLERICQASSYPRANEICLTPVPLPSCEVGIMRGSLDKNMKLLIELVLLIGLIFIPYLCLRNGPFYWTNGETPDRVWISRNFTVYLSIFTSILIITYTTITLLTISSVPVMVWINHLIQSIVPSLLCYTLWKELPIIQEEEGEKEPLIVST